MCMRGSLLLFFPNLITNLITFMHRMFFKGDFVVAGYGCSRNNLAVWDLKQY